MAMKKKVRPVLFSMTKRTASKKEIEIGKVQQSNPSGVLSE